MFFFSFSKKETTQYRLLVQKISDQEVLSNDYL